MSPSPQLCRCLPKRRRAPTHERRQHFWWSEPSPPGGMARLATGTPRRRPPLSSGPTSVWRQPSLSAALRGRQRAARSFWRWCLKAQRGAEPPAIHTSRAITSHYGCDLSSITSHFSPHQCLCVWVHIAASPQNKKICTFLCEKENRFRAKKLSATITM